MTLAFHNQPPTPAAASKKQKKCATFILLRALLVRNVSEVFSKRNAQFRHSEYIQRRRVSTRKMFCVSDGRRQKERLIAPSTSYADLVCRISPSLFPFTNSTTETHERHWPLWRRESFGDRGKKEHLSLAMLNKMKFDPF